MIEDIETQPCQLRLIQMPWQRRQSEIACREVPDERMFAQWRYPRNLFKAYVISTGLQLLITIFTIFGSKLSGDLACGTVKYTNGRTSKAVNCPPNLPCFDFHEAISPTPHSPLALSMLATIRMGSSEGFRATSD
jgi:hypothetical protein